MRAATLLLLSLSAVAATGCKRGGSAARAEDAGRLPLPPEAATQVVPLQAPDAGGRATAADVEACQRGLARGLEEEIEAVAPAKRAAPALGVLGAHCARVLGALGTAARAAASLGHPERARVLAEGARPQLPPTCVAPDPAAAALEVSYACPPPDAFALSEALLGDLDAGTFLFALAARERLAALGALDSRADLVLSNLVLGAALEAEAKGR